MYPPNDLHFNETPCGSARGAAGFAEAILGLGLWENSGFWESSEMLGPPPWQRGPTSGLGQDEFVPVPGEDDDGFGGVA